MIFITKPLNLTMNTDPKPLEFFLRHTDPLSRIARESCFIRYIGMKHDDAAYIAAIKKIDDHFAAANSQTPYVRLDHLEKIINPEQIHTLSQQYDAWIQLKNCPPQMLFQHRLPIKFATDALEWTQKLAFQSILTIFEKAESTATASMIRNFGIKILGWMAIYLPRLFQRNPAKQNFPKLVFIGKIKRQEQLFLYFLALLGCDILYINPEQDIDRLYPNVAAASLLVQEESLHACALPIPPFAPPAKVSLLTKPRQAAPLAASPSNKSSTIDLTRSKKSDSANAPELSYEELAKRANSVVMIKVYDDDEKPLKTGSGIVIHSSGYILTNLHVVCNGSNFSVQFENEEQAYQTQTLIKYHSDYDMAIIKVGKTCSSLTLYNNTPLVRGQKVVAIGSPLGLFNTVSDGIISGFRNVDKKSMVQFTAPISPGSSGGALLDVHGKLIGLITANFDDGQNLNLAVDHQTIEKFIRNFI